MASDLEKRTNRESRGVSRRHFLGLSAALLGLVAPVMPASATEPRAPIASATSVGQQSRERWDISYMWHPDIEAILDYKEEIEETLGEGVARRLRVVKGKTNYGLVYDRNEDRRSTVEIAATHSKILTENDLDPASAIRDEGYQELYNVSYGLGPNLSELKRRYAVVQKVLGPEVGKRLFIEQSQSGNYVLVYRRRGSLNTTKDVALSHSRKLKAEGIQASFAREGNNQVIYRGSNKITDEEEEKPEAERKPAAKKPATKKPKPALIAPPRTTMPAGDLERILITQFANEKRAGRIAKDEEIAFSVYDFTTGEKLVSINEDSQMQSASMMKPFVALGIMHEVAHGRKYTASIKRDMERMIQNSSNSATNRLINTLGGPAKLQKLLQKNYRGIFQQTTIKEYIPRGGRSYQNKASAHDYSRFLYALYNNNMAGSKEIRRLMGLPGRDRLYTGAVKVPAGTGVINKTGSTAMLCGDMGILYAKGNDGRTRAYTVVGIIQKKVRASNYGAWISARGNVIRRASNTIYQHQQRRHRLI